MYIYLSLSTQHIVWYATVLLHTFFFWSCQLLYIEAWLRYNLSAIQRSPRSSAASLSVWIAVENVLQCLIRSVNSRNKLAFIVIPVTVADKQPSPKYNEMWSIISRAGTRQFQNLPSDVMFFFPVSVFHHVFVLSIFPLHLHVSHSICQRWLPWNRRPSALQGLRDQSSSLSSDYSLTQWK